MVFRAPGRTILGGVKSTPELQLGRILSKRVCTVDYDFTGYRQYGLPQQSANVGIVPRNTFYYKDKNTDLYAPVLAIEVESVSSGTEFSVAHPDGAKIPAGAVLRLWDDSSKTFIDLNSSSEDVVVSSVTNGTTIDTITLGSSFSTAVESSDMVLIGHGVENIEDWVIFDQEVDLRADAAPTAISANFSNSFVYSGRVNSPAIPQWRQFRNTLQSHIRQNVGRLNIDDVK